MSAFPSPTPCVSDNTFSKWPRYYSCVHLLYAHTPPHTIDSRTSYPPCLLLHCPSIVTLQLSKFIHSFTIHTSQFPFSLTKRCLNLVSSFLPDSGPHCPSFCSFFFLLFSPFSPPPLPLALFPPPPSRHPLHTPVPFFRLPPLPCFYVIFTDPCRLPLLSSVDHTPFTPPSLPHPPSA